jgi:hypothetical protein
MSSESFANFRSAETTISGETTINFGIRVRRLTIMNDSATKTLQFKFNESEDYGTLNPTETISLAVITSEVFLNADSVPCRTWGTG